MSLAAAVFSSHISKNNNCELIYYYLLWQTTQNSYFTNKIKVHDNGFFPEAGIIFPGGAGNIFFISKKINWLTDINFSFWRNRNLKNISRITNSDGIIQLNLVIVIVLDSAKFLWRIFFFHPVWICQILPNINRDILKLWRPKK